MLPLHARVSCHQVSPLPACIPACLLHSCFFRESEREWVTSCGIWQLSVWCECQVYAVTFLFHVLPCMSNGKKMVIIQMYTNRKFCSLAQKGLLREWEYFDERAWVSVVLFSYLVVISSGSVGFGKKYVHFINMNLFKKNLSVWLSFLLYIKSIFVFFPLILQLLIFFLSCMLWHNSSATVLPWNTNTVQLCIV